MDLSRSAQTRHPGGGGRVRALKPVGMRPLESAALANKEYVAEQYRRWKADPASVGPEWSLFFAGYELAGQTLDQL